MESSICMAAPVSAVGVPWVGVPHAAGGPDQSLDTVYKYHSRAARESAMHGEHHLVHLACDPIPRQVVLLLLRPCTPCWGSTRPARCLFQHALLAVRSEPAVCHELLRESLFPLALGQARREEVCGALDDRAYLEARRQLRGVIPLVETLGVGCPAQLEQPQLALELRGECLLWKLVPPARAPLPRLGPLQRIGNRERSRLCPGSSLARGARQAWRRAWREQGVRASGRQHNEQRRVWCRWRPWSQDGRLERARRAFCACVTRTCVLSRLPAPNRSSSVERFFQAPTK